jgi:hypothetical protein
MDKRKDSEKKNGYNLSRQWFNWCFEHSEIVRPIHTALYFWIIELNNRLQWKDVFGLPTDYSMQAINIKGRLHYRKALDDLAKWGFIKIIAKSRNQHSSNQISLNLLGTLSTNQGSNQGAKQGTHSKTIQTVKTFKTNPLISPKGENEGDHLTLKTEKESPPVKERKQPISESPLQADPVKEEPLPVAATPPPESPPKKQGQSFIDELIDIFLAEYRDANGIEYVITTRGKELAAAGVLLGLYKKKFPEADTVQARESLTAYLRACVRVNDKWLQENMSLSIIISQFNRINKILKNGTGQYRATSDADIDAIVNEFFGKSG